VKFHRFVFLLMTAAAIEAADQPVPPQQNIAVPFRLFNTSNVYTVVKLDTRDGRVWQVQWNFETKLRWEAPINSQPLTNSPEVGRFTLYQTPNIHTFILVDQQSGRLWQVNWAGGDDGARGFFAIPDASAD
jgi:hypothetical protein